MSAVEIHPQLMSVYGEDTMNVQHVRKWVCKFLSEREEVHDLARVQWPSEAQTSDAIYFRTPPYSLNLTHLLLIFF